ncbi:MAG: pantetheine-phosphate adenylyltransferase [Myxococcota bacterium]
MRRAMYAGSFDPPTNGHIDIVQRGAKLFDELIIGIGSNPSKRYHFETEHRKSLFEACVEDLDNVRVVTFSGLVVEAMATQGVEVLLRGIRTSSDLDLEFRNGLANRDLAGVETLFLLTDPDHIFVSSSLVREIAKFGGDISKYVPPVVAQAMRLS